MPLMTRGHLKCGDPRGGVRAATSRPYRASRVVSVLALFVGGCTQDRPTEPRSDALVSRTDVCSAECVIVSGVGAFRAAATTCRLKQCPRECRHDETAR